MKFSKHDGQKADSDILDQIIQACEGKMVSPFKKKTAVAVEVKPDESEPDGDDSKSDSGMSDDDMDDLLKMYAEKHGR
jgi:hypothetical protein